MAAAELGVHEDDLLLAGKLHDQRDFFQRGVSHFGVVVAGADGRGQDRRELPLLGEDAADVGVGETQALPRLSALTSSEWFAALPQISPY